MNLNQILTYLLSSGRLDAIVGLPLIPRVNGPDIFLTECPPGCTSYVLLDFQAESVFSPLDPNAISLSQLPPAVQDLLLRDGEGRFNVKSLSCDIVMNYLHFACKRFGIHAESSTTIVSSQVSAEALEWFTVFWGWLSSWILRKELYQSLASLPSLPTSVDSLQCPRDGVFLSVPDDNLRRLLQKIGIPFIFHSTDLAVRTYLQEQGSTRQTSNVPDLLHHVHPNNVASLDASQIVQLRDHLIVSSDGLRDNDREKLRSLPIFRRLRPCAAEQGKNSVASGLENIADNEDILCVPNHVDLPLIDRVFYISDSDLQLAALLKPDIRPLSEVELLQKAVENFPAQPEEWQYRFLSRMWDIRQEIPPRLLDDLRRCQFILADNGVFYSPAHIFDPASPVAELLLPNDHRLPPPRMSESFVDAMRRLDLLNVELTIDLCQERMQFVAGQRLAAEDIIIMAEKLLLAMERQSMDYSALCDDINHLAWLPTDQGLFRPGDCRDNRDASLCKDVLPLLTGGREVQSQPLRKVFGWDARVPLSVIVKRFKHILADDHNHSGSASDLCRLIPEFGFHLDAGKLDDSIVQELKEYTKDKSWIPISGSSHDLSPAMFAVFDAKHYSPGFHRIRTSLAKDPGSKIFLEIMGCTQLYVEFHQ
jgi:hypothetical protein